MAGAAKLRTSQNPNAEVVFVQSDDNWQPNCPPHDSSTVILASASEVMPPKNPPKLHSRFARILNPLVGGHYPQHTNPKSPNALTKKQRNKLKREARGK